MRVIPIFVLSVVIVFSLLFFGCVQGKEETSDKVILVVDLYPYEFLAKEIGGEHVSVINLLGNGKSPHGFEPAPSQIVTIHKSDLFIYMGAPMDPWAEDVAEGIPNEKKIRILDINKSLLISKGGMVDPHVWLDPLLFLSHGEAIKDKLISIDSLHKGDYEKNFQNLRTKLLSLHKYIEENLRNLKKREYIVFHPAYNYFNKRYNLTYAAVVEETPGSEPSAKRISEILQIIKDMGISAIYVEPQMDKRVAQAIAEEADVKILELNPIPSLTEENLRNSDDYISVMKKNVDSLVEGCG